MPKGLISQTVVVLLRRAISVADLKSLLTEFNVVKELAQTKQWEFGGPGLIVEYLREVNGLVSVDIVDRPWPDDMGNPKQSPMLFGAWTMGWFGPFTFPGNLQRAMEQSWKWPEAKVAAPTHGAFIRIRVSYTFGLPKDAKCLPANYAPLPELDFITALASTLLQHHEAICYFNPNGEMLLPKLLLDEDINSARSQTTPALNIWTNIRLFSLNAEWLLMDTVGNWQMDIHDQEMIVPREQMPLTDVERWLRNVSLYVLKREKVIKDGDTITGPGNVLGG